MPSQEIVVRFTRQTRFAIIAFMAIIGIAQWFRTPIERASSVVFAVAAVWSWIVVRSSRYSMGVALGVCAVALGSRGLTVLWTLNDTPWHSELIVASVWGSLAYVFAVGAWRLMAGNTRPVRGGRR